MNLTFKNLSSVHSEDTHVSTSMHVQVQPVALKIRLSALKSYDSNMCAVQVFFVDYHWTAPTFSALEGHYSSNQIETHVPENHCNKPNSHGNLF